MTISLARFAPFFPPALCALFILTGSVGAEEARHPHAELPGADVQGEYVGEIPRGEGETVTYGVQIIARGEGAYEAAAYEGGLPGAGWNGEPPARHEGHTGRETDARFESDLLDAEILSGRLRILDKQGNRLATLERVVRTSPTLGAEPPEGAVVLYDLDGPNDFPNTRVQEGLGLREGAVSETTFQDARIHLEFILPFQPAARGQGRGNSGVYLQGRYEVQILDSFGLEGLHSECGGIYGIKAPDVNMCLPPLQWQTYDIDFKAARFDDQGNKTAPARMTVRHNGVLIHDDVEVPRATAAARLGEGPEPGPLYLQDHGNLVIFRNVWIVPR